MKRFILAASLLLFALGASAQTAGRFKVIPIEPGGSVFEPGVGFSSGPGANRYNSFSIAPLSGQVGLAAYNGGFAYGGGTFAEAVAYARQYVTPTVGTFLDDAIGTPAVGYFGPTTDGFFGNPAYVPDNVVPELKTLPEIRGIVTAGADPSAGVTITCSRAYCNSLTLYDLGLGFDQPRLIAGQSWLSTDYGITYHTYAPKTYNKDRCLANCDFNKSESELNCKIKAAELSAGNQVVSSGGAVIGAIMGRIGGVVGQVAGVGVGWEMGQAAGTSLLDAHTKSCAIATDMDYRQCKYGVCARGTSGQ
jgi:hypothetical protein